MTLSDDPVTKEGQPPADHASALGEELGRQSRLLHILRTHMSSWAPAGMDWAAFGVLMKLSNLGPCRQSELAEASLLDPSTVSRHAGQLVRNGMACRQPDPQDGRAVHLVVTEQGRALAEHLYDRRHQFLTSIVGDWDEADTVTLLNLLRRLNDRFEYGLENGLREESFLARLPSAEPAPDPTAPPGPLSTPAHHHPTTAHPHQATKQET